MKRVVIACIVAVLCVAGFFIARHMRTKTLSVTYGPNGLEQLSFGSTVLEDTAGYPADIFHIWHMKVTDLQGNVLPQFGWGENNSGRSWDAANHRWTYIFPWGSIQTEFAVHGNQLDMIVTEQNHAGSGVILAGAVLYPLALHFPELPADFHDSTYPQLAYTSVGPGVTVADFNEGQAVMVTPDAARPLYSGFWPTNNESSYTAMIASTVPDSLATFRPHFDRPVQPGQTETFTVSLRFAPSGVSSTNIAMDAYSNFARIFPSRLNWSDRRPIGTVYLASAPSDGPADQPGGFPNNPRRYFNDGNPDDFDLRAPEGQQAFQKRVLEQAQKNVANMRAIGAQGAVTWDLEGGEYPHAVSYVCSPDQIAAVAPEMESVVTDANSPFRGMKLDDAYFKIMRDAGFLVGVCVRPQHFAVSADHRATQTGLDTANTKTELLKKIAFAHDRWGARLFYIDSSIDLNGGALDPGLLEQLQQAFPDSLLMPEQSTPRSYAYTAPLKAFIFHGETGSDPAMRAVYPRGFSVVEINDAEASALAAATAKITESAKAGDVLMGHVDYGDPNNATIVSITQNARKR